MIRRRHLPWFGALLAVILVPLLAYPQSARVLAEWIGLGPAPTSSWKQDIGNSNYWLAAHPTDSTISCADVKTKTLQALNGGDTWFVGVDTAYGDLGGHYTPEHEVVVDSSLTLDLQLGTVIHEAMHHAGYGNDSNAPDNNDDFIACFTKGREDGKEDDEDDDGNDGSGSSGGGGGPRIVSKVPHSTEPNVWTIVYVPSSSSGSAELGEITVVCDYDDETTWPDCPDAEEK
ncbi:MAG: hypothetical protein F4Z78_15250 [Gammaproteobacteria bacterium]|nr:hypothetical protein [Gammaproteobacteria bacterium]